MNKFIAARNRVRSAVIRNFSDTNDEMGVHSDLAIMTEELARVIAEKEAALAILRSCKQ